jgi:hypothetical protein
MNLTPLAKSKADDMCFKSHGLAPKFAADSAFLLRGFHFRKYECEAGADRKGGANRSGQAQCLPERAGAAAAAVKLTLFGQKSRTPIMHPIH